MSLVPSLPRCGGSALGLGTVWLPLGTLSRVVCWSRFQRVSILESLLVVCPFVSVVWHFLWLCVAFHDCPGLSYVCMVREILWPFCVVHDRLGFRAVCGYVVGCCPSVVP